MEGLPTFIMVEKEGLLERVHTFLTRVILTAYKAKLTIEPLNAKHVREGYISKNEKESGIASENIAQS